MSKIFLYQSKISIIVRISVDKKRGGRSAFSNPLKSKIKNH
jgi:hypothetical protein